MLIRKNTKEYKALNNLIQYYSLKDKSTQQKNINLYIVENGKTIQDKISIAEQMEQKDFYYQTTFETIRASFDLVDYQIHKTEDKTPLYFFRNTHQKNWDQNPFELSKSLQSKLLSFADMPAIAKPIKPKVKSVKEKKVTKPPEKKKPNKISLKSLADYPEIKPGEEESKKNSTSWIEVTSEGIEAINYNSSRKTLYIRFRPEHDTYAYYEVSKKVYQQLMKEEHKTTFVNKNIKGKYDYEYIGKMN